MEIHSELPGTGETPLQYLELATGLMRQSKEMIAAAQFNHGQCTHLVKKLETTVQCASDSMSLSSPEQMSVSMNNWKCMEKWKFLVRLAMDVQSFIQECCIKEIQAASMLMNAFEHVASLSSHLDLCIWSFKNAERIILGTALRWELTSISEDQDRGLLNQVNLLEKVEAALNPESISNSQVIQRVCSVLRGLEATLGNPIAGNPDLAELSVRDQVNLLIKVEEALSSESISNPEERQLAASLVERFRAAVANPVSDKPLNVDFMRVDYESLERDSRPFLGKGASGEVYKVKWLGTPVAEKTLLEQNEGNLHEFDQEVSILARLSHPNIVRLLCYVKGGVKCSVVQELMDKALTKLIKERVELHENSEFPFSTSEVVDIMLEIAEGMDYLHRRKVLHRDLKSQNILVKCEKREEIGVELVHAKVADFGISKTKERSITLSHPTWNMGTTRWMAPELIHIRPRGCAGSQTGDWYPEWNPYKSDVYSFGMVCYEILTGHEPFINDAPRAMKQKVLEDKRPGLPPRYPSCLRSMIQKCWRPEPMERPSFSEICAELRFKKGSLLIGRDL